MEVDWIQLTQAKDQWWNLVNTIINFQFQKILGIS